MTVQESTPPTDGFKLAAVISWEENCVLVPISWVQNTTLYWLIFTPHQRRQKHPQQKELYLHSIWRNCLVSQRSQVWCTQYVCHHLCSGLNCPSRWVAEWRQLLQASWQHQPTPQTQATTEKGVRLRSILCAPITPKSWVYVYRKCWKRANLKRGLSVRKHSIEWMWDCGCFPLCCTFSIFCS